MRTNIVRAVLTLVATVLGLSFAGGQINAQGFRFASETDSAVWNQFAPPSDGLPLRLVDYASAGDGCDNGCNDGCSRAGWVGSSELLFLKPFQSEGSGSTFLPVDPDYNYRTGYRGTIGWQRYDGLGFRIRFFDYFQRVPSDQRFDISTLDGELYDTLVDNETWFLSIGGGIRYLDFFLGNSPDPRDGVSQVGVGPVVTAELQRHLNERLSLYAITRASIVVGDNNVFGTVVPDQTGRTFDIQLGGQWNRPWRNAILFGRIGWEAQYYADLVTNDSESASLIGGVLSGGIIR
jgi:hypothetical protein